MNKILIILSFVLLASCGSSQKDKNIAAVTCSIMSETRNMDAAIRVREMNDAREKIGGEPFLGGDSAIQEAFEWGLCQELVLNENYDEILQPLKYAKRERERIATEKRAEERRIAAEKLAEENRVAAEKLAEEQRIAAEKLAEEQRIAAEKQRIADTKPSVKEEFYPNGKLKTRGNYQPKSDGGKEHGLYETYYENGQLFNKGNYIDGKRVGLWESYYENGQLLYRGNYIDGKEDGFKEIYMDNGLLLSRGNYIDGKRDGLNEWYSTINGKLRDKQCYKNDVERDISYCEK